MHIEPPTGRIQSFKAFLGHYLMIVLSILTALGLEEWVQHAHRLEAGRQAQETIEAEARENLKNVHRWMAVNVTRRESLEKWSRVVGDALKSGMPDAKIRKDIIAPSANAIDISGPAWGDFRRVAWDVAIANQSVAYVEPARLAAMSELYSRQQLMTNVLPLVSTGFVKFDQLVIVMTDLQMGNVEPRTLLHTLNQVSESVNEANQNLQSVEKLLERVAGENPQSANESAIARPASAASN